MKRTASYILAILIGAGCSSTGTWQYTKLDSLPVEKTVPAATSCTECHQPEYETWKKTDHSDAESMKKITVTQLLECGACHDNLAAHLETPDKATPTDLAKIDKTALNQVCGKCHFNKELMGWDAINPNNEHGFITSVGFEGKEEQLSCLDCHDGHSGKRNMLEGIQAHTCFKCHKSAIVTMGAFQPLNYVAAGEVCTACHAPHGTSKVGQAGRMATGVTLVCVACHLP
ncbi:MAG: cytochrome c3 family protein [bacterium]